MKQMKKILAMAMALVMVFALATTAFADEVEPPVDDNKIEISVVASESGASVAGHTYEVYQIFTGTVAKDGKTLSDIVIGANVTDRTVEQVQELIKDMSGADAAEKLAEIVTGEPIEVLNDANSFKAKVDPGYYLIIDVTEKLPENETKSAFILQVLEPVAIKSKHTAGPKVEKKIDDTNNSTEAENEIVWHDSADHDIGDSIPFKLQMTVPSAFQLFKDNNTKAGATRIPYRFVFHDTEEQGLTFENITKVTVDGVEITSGYELVRSPEDGHTFDVIFADLTAIESVKVDSVIVVEYTSILNENAILGNKGNVNKVYGEYRNFYDDEHPYITPEDYVIAFTYKVIVNKVKNDNQPLAGAEFTLEKFVANTKGTETYNGVNGNWVALDQVETEPGTVFTFTGLDDGEYRLTETKAPDGYNKIDPIYFTVTADHDIEWEKQDRLEVLNSLTGDVPTGKITFAPVNDVVKEEDKETIVSANVGLSANVVNQAGVVLPETGGIGTTIFYVIGGLLAVAAIVLLIAKKRMASAE